MERNTTENVDKWICALCTRVIGHSVLVSCRHRFFDNCLTAYTQTEKSSSYLKVSPAESLNGLGSSDFSSVSSGDRDQEPEFRENVDKWRCPLCTRVVRNPVRTPCGHQIHDSCRVDDMANVSTKKSKSYFKVTRILQDSTRFIRRFLSGFWRERPSTSIPQECG